MLKLTDEGAKFTLQDTTQPSDTGLFWFALALLLGAIGVAVAMSLLPERWAIGALALLIVGCFVFNRQRQQRKQAADRRICCGTLWVQAGKLIHDGQGKRNVIVLNDTDQVVLLDQQVQIVDKDNQPKYHISGFDTDQEARVTKALLEGQALTKRHATIKMNGDGR